MEKWIRENKDSFRTLPDKSTTSLTYSVTPEINKKDPQAKVEIKVVNPKKSRKIDHLDISFEVSSLETGLFKPPLDDKGNNVYPITCKISDTAHFRVKTTNKSENLNHRLVYQILPVSDTPQPIGDETLTLTREGTPNDAGHQSAITITEFLADPPEDVAATDLYNNAAVNLK